MRFVIISHVLHFEWEGRRYAYAPYVREMNLWGNHVSSFEIVAPAIRASPSAIQTAYSQKNIAFRKVPSFSFVSLREAILSLLRIPYILFRIFGAMRRADHIHLRCPGNMGLLGCVAQVFFPKKPKSAKYAGNWDPSAEQPLSYRIQKWILGNTFLTRNMKVLVYGQWEGQSKNIVPFFTATYPERKQTELVAKQFAAPWKFLFVGTLSPGKRPLYAVQLVEQLQQCGHSLQLDVYGEGPERAVLESYIEAHRLEAVVKLHGNQTADTVERAYNESHFLILPSKSEGWPKVVAEMMFWGGVALVTPVSCVPWMLDGGKRGILLSETLATDVDKISTLLEQPQLLEIMAQNAAAWSQQYTLHSFEASIKKVLE
jgi:glycosyltransferase involved in cell wall biosynthesis